MAERIGTRISQEEFTQGEIENQKSGKRCDKQCRQLRKIGVAPAVSNSCDTSGDQNARSRREPVQAIDEVESIANPRRRKNRQHNPDRRKRYNHVQISNTRSINPHTQQSNGNDA